MAGVPAGRLSIEIVAEIARLQADLDKAKRAVNAASKDIAASAKHANDNLAGLGSGITKAGGQSRLAAHHVQNLAFQFQDMAIGLQGGQKPLTVFLQQGSQIAGVMSQAGIGVSGLAKEIAGMTGRFVKAHPYLVAFTVAVGIATGALAKLAGEVGSDRQAELDAYAKSLGLTKKEMKELGTVGITAGDVISGVWTTIKDGLGLEAVFTSIKGWAASAFNTILTISQNVAAGIYAAFAGTFEGIKHVWNNLPAVLGDAAVSAANLVITAIEGMINRAITAINALAMATNPLLAAAKMAGFDMSIGPVSLGRIENANAGAGQAAGAAFVKGYQDAFNDAKGAFGDLGDTLSDNIFNAAKERLGTKASELIDDRTDKAAKKGGKKAGDEFAKAFKRAVEEALQNIRGLEDQISKFGKSALEIQRMEIATKAAAAPTTELAQRIRELGAELERLQIEKAAADFDKMIQALRDENSLIGLTGDALEYKRLELEKTGKMAEWAAQGLTDLNERWLTYATTRLSGIEQKSTLERDADAAEVLLDRMNALNSGLGSGPLGSIFGVLTSKDPTSALLGMGGLGTLAGMFTKGGQEAYAKQRAAIRDGLVDVLGEKASGLAETMAGLLQGAGTGSIVGGIMGGGTTAKLGSSIGGAIGQAVGSKVLSSLGSAAGPIGAIAGAIAGNLLGQIIGGHKTGGSVITGSGDALGAGGTWGDTKSFKQTGSSAANATVATLAKIAEAFGATLGTFTGAFGVRDGNLTYNPTGAASTKAGKGAINFGKDEAAMMKAAIADAISDGVFSGLSAGVERLLKAPGDIEKNLQKALSFQGVFDELSQRKDPKQFELDQLDKWRAGMDKIFAEAGATAEEIAKLEELTGMKRADIVEKYADQLVGTEAILAERRELQIQLLVATGQAEQALAMVRADQLSAIDASNRALQEQVWAAQDAAQAAADLTAQLDRMSNLQIRLYQAQGNDSAALALQRQLELSKAASDAERALLQQIYAAEDAARTSSAAASSPSRETADNAAEQLLKQRQSMEIELLRLQGKETEALARQRQLELAALDPSLRALQQQIYAEQDLAKVREDAVKKVDNARAVLTKAYEAEASALNATIDKFKSFSDSLKDFRASLFTGSGFDDFTTLQRRFLQTSALANTGQEAALRDLPGAAKAFLDSALERSVSRVDYQLKVAEVARAVNQAIGAADDVVDYNELRLAALDRSVEGLIDLKEEVVSVRKAIEDLKQAVREQDANNQAGQVQIAKNTGTVAEQVERDRRKPVEAD